MGGEGLTPQSLPVDPLLPLPTPPHSPLPRMSLGWGPDDSAGRRWGREEDYWGRGTGAYLATPLSVPFSRPNPGGCGGWALTQAQWGPVQIQLPPLVAALSMAAPPPNSHPPLLAGKLTLCMPPYLLV